MRPADPLRFRLRGMTISLNSGSAKFRPTSPWHWLAFGCGAGLLKPAPGTWGTLIAVPFAWMLSWLSLPARCGVVGVAALAGIWICGRVGRDLGVADHSGIVWDEIVGYWVAVILFEWSWLLALLAFGLFRLFDIAKPLVVGWLDRNLHGGLGVMADDLAAGVLTALLLAPLAWGEWGIAFAPAAGQ